MTTVIERNTSSQKYAFCTMCCLAKFLSRCSQHTHLYKHVLVFLRCMYQFIFFIFLFACMSLALFYRERQVNHLVYEIFVLVFLYSVYLPFSVCLSSLIYYILQEIASERVSFVVFVACCCCCMGFKSPLKFAGKFQFHVILQNSFGIFFYYVMIQNTKMSHKITCK